MRPLVQFIPIATSTLALTFCTVLYDRWRIRGGRHLLWFAIGAATYAAGTIAESATTLFGWHEALFRTWYIAGALMGGAPLAQGAVYIHLSRRTADRLAVALVASIVIASACVIVSPIRYELVEPYRLTGNVLIAVGALLPGIGGTFTRFGYTEVLYVTELLGLALIVLGYRFTVTPSAIPTAPTPRWSSSRIAQ